MNMGVINLILRAHDARDAAHRLTIAGIGQVPPGQDPVRRAPAMNNGASTGGCR
jgi:hypothetical protein